MEAIVAEYLFLAVLAICIAAYNIAKLALTERTKRMALDAEVREAHRILDGTR